MIRRSSFCGPLAVLLALIVVCTVSRHCAVLLASLPMHGLTMVVRVLVVVWRFVLYVCESLIFVGGSVMVMVLQQYFQLSNLQVQLCS